MPRLYYKQEWYYELSPTALAESEFEALLIQNSDLIAPGSIMIPFKRTVESEYGTARADLAVISCDYREWVVIEAELDVHSLPGHVVPQARTLRTGFYDQTFAPYICSKDARLEVDRIEAMLLGLQPRVLVLVNKVSETWRTELGRYDVDVMGFELYRSDENRHIFLIDGEIRALPDDIITQLTWSLLPRCVKVNSPAALPFKTGERLPVFVDGQLTVWERFETAAECYLTPVGQMPLIRDVQYGLYEDDAGYYIIQPISKGS